MNLPFYFKDGWPRAELRAPRLRGHALVLRELSNKNRVNIPKRGDI